MGNLVFFDETVGLDNEPRVRCTHLQVQVVDNHAVPEIVIGPKDAAHEGIFATFNDWEQFERFVEAVNGLHSRLKSINE
ncbi:hypothetical protein [Shewanella fodinae]|uniref:Uncharacterized protein n=1 Tax=Shewanella fodinae TaxID=552357 RepID=A0A4R2F1S4_9GAMM|nr:hypothetical protein [Shewanella fodinae]TCN78483.1 hypothetical protein EDC91_13919 [Shewanella fodinae]